VWRRGRARQTARLTPPPTASRGGISATQVSPEGEVEGGDGRGGETEQDIARRRTRRGRAGRVMGVRRARTGEVESGGGHGGGTQSLGVRPRARESNGESGCPNQGEHQNEIDGDFSHPGASRTTKHPRNPAVYALTQERRRPRSQIPIAIPMAMKQTTWAGMGRQCGCHRGLPWPHKWPPFALVVMATGKVAAIRRPAFPRHGSRLPHRRGLARRSRAKTPRCAATRRASSPVGSGLRSCLSLSLFGGAPRALLP
jgi:hypothetical protein